MKPRTFLYLLVGLLVGVFFMPYSTRTSDVPEWPDCEAGLENKSIQLDAIIYSAYLEYKCDNLFAIIVIIGGDYPKSLSVNYIWCECWDESNFLHISDYRAFDWENYTREDLKLIRTLIDWKW
ncbi:hypothetical protein LCGC14_1282870 [marine sediment metagenome]|uniref:Uncharacterized protein n=1 Tax=marine sediment metagenome TaxID=412755 RepID=A0A0F9NXT5_9ZZZZ